MFEVWHAVNPTFGIECLFGERMPKPDWPSGFKLVAKVYCDEAEDAFRLTQHIDKEWWEHESVTLVEESRSTSVGDLIISGHVAYQVLSMGFKTYEIMDGLLVEKK